MRGEALRFALKFRMAHEKTKLQWKSTYAISYCFLSSWLQFPILTVLTWQRKISTAASSVWAHYFVLNCVITCFFFRGIKHSTSSSYEHGQMSVDFSFNKRKKLEVFTNRNQSSFFPKKQSIQFGFNVEAKLRFNWNLYTMVIFQYFPTKPLLVSRKFTVNLSIIKKFSLANSFKPRKSPPASTKWTRILYVDHPSLKIYWYEHMACKKSENIRWSSSGH